jgi:PAS domain-containing protein
MPRPPKEGLTAARLGALAAATLLAPLVAAAAPQQQQQDVALLASGVLFLLVLARLAGLTGALDRTEARFSSLVHHGADPIVVLDPQARVRYASPAWNRLVGEPDCRTDDSHDCVDLVTRVAPESLDELAGELAALVGSLPRHHGGLDRPAAPGRRLQAARRGDRHQPAHRLRRPRPGAQRA